MKGWMGTYNLLTWKPVIYAANVSEDDLADDGGPTNMFRLCVNMRQSRKQRSICDLCGDRRRNFELDDDEKNVPGRSGT